MSYVSGTDSRSTDSFVEANTISAMPITTSTAERSQLGKASITVCGAIVETIFVSL
jgi:hypothetical protein